MAAAVLAAFGRKGRSSLVFWDLAKAGLAVLIECLHAVSAAPVADTILLELELLALGRRASLTFLSRHGVFFL